MKDILEKYGAYLAAAVIFIILAFAYCKPVLSGKVLQSNDDLNAVSAIHEAEVYSDAEGGYGFWNGSMFSGMPNYQIGGGEYKSEKLIAPLKGFFHRGPAHPAWILIFYFVCFFILMRSFGIDRWLSIAGAIAVALSSYFIVIIAAGHGGKTIAISYITLTAAGFYLTYRKRYGLGAIFVMFFTAIGFSIHPQMSYYLFMMIGIFFLAELWIHIKEKRMKDFCIATAVFAASVLIGLGTGASNIFANREYAAETMRGGHSDLVLEGENPDAAASKGLDIRYATGWSYGIDETMTFMIPGFKGGATNYPVGADSDLCRTMIRNGVPSGSARSMCKSLPIYWGDQPFTAGNVYMGAIICFLFLLGCLIVKGPYKWALLASTVFSVMLAWGCNFMWLTRLFFNYFPLYNKFRAVSSILIVAEIAMPLLGFLAVKELMEGGEEKKKEHIRGIFLSAGITAGLCLIFELFGRSVFDFRGINDASFFAELPEWFYSAILSTRADLLVSDSWRSFLFIALAAVLLLLFATGKVKRGVLAAVLGVLVVADLWPVDQRYFNDDYFKSPSQSRQSYEMKPYEQLLLQDTDPHFRILDLTTAPFNDARPSYYLKSIGGYHAAKLRRYQDLIDSYLSQGDIAVMGMLNTKYIIDPEGIPQVNGMALGNAWFVDSLLVGETPNEEMALLGKIDLATKAVVGRDFADAAGSLNPGIAPDAEVHLTSYLPRKIDYSCTSSEPGTIVFSEIYYPHGWKASVDGEPADHFRANYTLRAMSVPAGEHTISFVFDPDSVRKGDAIATACILLMYALTLAIIIFGIIRWRRSRA